MKLVDIPGISTSYSHRQHYVYISCIDTSIAWYGPVVIEECGDYRSLLAHIIYRMEKYIECRE